MSVSVNNVKSTVFNGGHEHNEESSGGRNNFELVTPSCNTHRRDTHYDRGTIVFKKGEGYDESGECSGGEPQTGTLPWL